MTAAIKKIVERLSTGIYVGPDAVIAATSRHTLRSRTLESVHAEIWQAESPSFTPDFSGVDALRRNLNILLEKASAWGNIQVAFDDRYVRFFVLPLTEKPSGKEVDNLLRWHAEKVLPDSRQYRYTSQLVETPSGLRLYGAAISEEIAGAIDDVLHQHKLPCYMADSAASYLWNSFSEQYKTASKAYVSLAKYGWTLILSNASGGVELIKPGRWSYDPSGVPQLKKGMIEAHRLLATFVDKQPQARPDCVYIDFGAVPDAVGVAKELFGEDLVVGHQQDLPSQSVSAVSQPYTHELTIALKASLPR